jgi:hypothetical protein
MSNSRVPTNRREQPIRHTLDEARAQRDAMRAAKTGR